MFFLLFDGHRGLGLRPIATLLCFCFALLSMLDIELGVFNVLRQARSGRDRPLCRQRHQSNVLGYRSRTLTLNPNSITDPNPNPKNNKKRKRHRNEIEHIVII